MTARALRDDFAVARAALASLLTVAVLLCIAYTLADIAPFGDATMSVANRDGQIQYLDFIAYFQNVASGKDTLDYTLNKGLGGSGIAVLSYYLASPFNMLFLFVSNADIPVMFNIVVALKLALAAAAMSVYLSYRFSGLSRWLNLSVSVSYGLMEYGLAQSSNIMWLDGVYMLPIMMGALHHLVAGGSIAPLSIATGLAIIFNWYTGAIDCLFIVLWFFFEVALDVLLSQREGGGLKGRLLVRHLLQQGLRFAFSMAIGVGLSSFLFFPTVFELMGGRASGGWLSFQWLEFAANPLNMVGGLELGSLSSNGHVALYCGSMIVVGCLAALFNRSFARASRLLFAFVIIFCAICFYWQPLFALFSLFQSATSYWYRYSYIAVAALAYIAAMYFERECVSPQSERARFWHVLPAAALICCALLGYGSYRDGFLSVRLIATCGFILSCGALLFLTGIKGGTPLLLHAPHFRSLIVCASCALLLCELGVNANLLVSAGAIENVEHHARYAVDQQGQIDAIEGQGEEIFRIAQTRTEYMEDTGLTANYNEGLAYGYAPIASYTSDPINSQREFLAQMGYPICGDNINVVNTSILGIDSLLGVEYVLSPYSISGLDLRDDLPVADGKSVYQNPYAMPLAFTSGRELSEEHLALEGLNPFESQNALYSYLLGQPVELYQPLAFTEDIVEDSGGYSATYDIGLPGEGYAIYGNILLEDQWIPSTLDVAGSDSGYSQWLAPSVFYIPEGVSSVELRGIDGNVPLEAQFYALDLELLDRCISELRAGDWVAVDYEGSKVTMEVDSTVGSRGIVTSIPYDESWTIEVNGVAVEPRDIAGGLQWIPVQPGTNEIRMRYHLRGGTFGLVVTFASVILLAAQSVFRSGKGPRRVFGEAHETGGALSLFRS